MNAIPFASVPTGTLIATIEDFIQVDSEVMLRAYWRRWTSWRDNSGGIIKELLSNPNPEVVLSLSDLYEAALLRSGHRLAKMLGGRNIRIT